MNIRKLLKNKAKITLSVVIAAAILTMNFGSLLNCTSLTMGEDCCHITNKVKPCCAKNVKITLNERLSGHCGCTMQESQQASDLYTDLKNTNLNNVSRDLQNSYIIENVYNSDFSAKSAAAYSPPLNYQTDSYLVNSVLRI